MLSTNEWLGAILFILLVVCWQLGRIIAAQEATWEYVRAIDMALSAHRAHVRDREDRDVG